MFFRGVGDSLALLYASVVVLGIMTGAIFGHRGTSFGMQIGAVTPL